MQRVSLFWDTLEVTLGEGPDLVDITPRLNRLVQASGIATASLSACMIGSTGSLTTIEWEPGVVEDLKNAIHRLAPRNLEYAHEKAWHDGNGHSHVQAALLGPSVVLPVRDGRLKLGTWQQVVAINHDNRPRTRKIEVTVTGTLA